MGKRIGRKKRRSRNAERQRRYRERLRNNPEKHAEYLKSERERYHRRADRCKIQSLSEKEKRAKRKQWREAKLRERMKALEEPGVERRSGLQEREKVENKTKEFITGDIREDEDNKGVAETFKWTIYQSDTE